MGKTRKRALFVGGSLCPRLHVKAGPPLKAAIEVTINPLMMISMAALKGVFLGCFKVFLGGRTYVKHGPRNILAGPM